MKPIFVTGANGFIGRRLCERLAESGEHIIALCRSDPPKFRSANIEIIRGDLRDPASFEMALAQCDRVFHLAAIASQWHPEPEIFEDVNVTATRKLLDACQRHDVERFVFTSTAGVLAKGTLDAPIDENGIAKVEQLPSQYQQTKLRAQQFVESVANSRMQTVVVMPSRVFGPGRLSESNSLTRILRLYQRGWWRWIPGDGSAVGNYVFVDDVVEGHVAAMRRGHAGQRYILGGENLSFRELFRVMGHACGTQRWMVNVPLFLMNAFARWEQWKSDRFHIRPRLTPAFVTKYTTDHALDIEKSKSELGYLPTPTEEAMGLTLAEQD
ncbi:MAG: NAD-dependent epimerase/dehydratase family protein [Planctomycetota bacterium]